MATANELLADMSTVDKTLIISNDLRTINIPSSVSNIGVEYDDDVLRLEFRMPRYIGDTDLSAFAIRINYINSKGESDAYTVNDAVIGTQHITFSWLVGPTATRYRGNTKFNVCAKTIRADGTVDKEFNTTIATLPVLEGLEVDESIVTEYSDIIEQWKQQLFGIGDTEEASIKAVSQAEQEAIANEGARVLATIPTDYATAVSMTDNADRTKSDAIVCTTAGEIITVMDSSDDYLRGLRVFGRTDQVSTTGKNLVNLPQVVNKPDSGYNYDLFMGTAGQATPVDLQHLDKLPYLTVGTYYLNAEFESGVANTEIKVMAVADDGTTSTASILATKSGVFTVDNDCRVTIRVGTSAATNISNIQIEAGDRYTGYEPYSGGVASPSPEWPQELTSVENPTLSIYGGNLLTDYTGYKMTQRGITCEFEGDGVYHIYGTFSGTNSSLQFADINLNIPIDPNAKYTLHGELVDGTLPDDYHPYIGLSSDTVNHRNWMALSIDSRHKVGDVVTSTMIPSATLNNPTHINKFWIYAHNDNLEPYTVDFRIRVWLTKSDSPIPYEPYTRQKLTVVNTIKAVPVSQNGNCTDLTGKQWICDEIDFKRGLYIQRVGSITFDGSTDEIWYDELVLDNTVMFRIQISNSVNVGNVVGKDYLCSNFSVKNMYNADVEGTQHTMQQFYFRINKSTLVTADIDGFKAYLTAHPITVQYVLAKPIETPLTTEEIEWFRFAHTSCPNTTVVNNAGVMMELTYNADTKTYLDNCSRPTDDQVRSSVDAWLSEHYTPAEGVSF